MTKPITVRALLLALCCVLCIGAAHAAPKRVALLIGVGDYPYIPKLEGPANDVVALRDVLVERWGFEASDIKTLVDKQATKAAILQELKALAGRSKSGDELVVYFSGHGTSALDPTGKSLSVPHGSGAFISYEMNPLNPNRAQQLIVGRTDLVPVFSALERSGRKLWVISDSCYSGQQVRSSQLADANALTPRTIPMQLDPDQILKQQQVQQNVASAPTIPPYPYTSVAFLAASSEGEKALDIPKKQSRVYKTTGDKAHGAFTDALLHVLEGKIPGDLDGNGLLTLNEVHRATLDFMMQRAIGHTPQRLPAVAEDVHGVGNAPVLSMRDVAAKPTQPIVAPLYIHAPKLPETLKTVLAGVPNTELVSQGAAFDYDLRQKDQNIQIFSAGFDQLALVNASATQALAAQVRQLAWAKRLRLLAEQHRRAALEMDVDPALMGGNFVLGSKIAFVVRPDKAATLVLLNISSDGKVSVLYPAKAAEGKPLAANQSVFIPGKEEHLRIKIQEPLGMDLVFAFAFDTPPPELQKMYGAFDMESTDARLALLESWLAAKTRQFSFATSSVRTLNPDLTP